MGTWQQSTWERLYLPTFAHLRIENKKNPTERTTGPLALSKHNESRCRLMYSVTGSGAHGQCRRALCKCILVTWVNAPHRRGKTWRSHPTRLRGCFQITGHYNHHILVKCAIMHVTCRQFVALMGSLEPSFIYCACSGMQRYTADLDKLLWRLEERVFMVQVEIVTFWTDTKCSYTERKKC